MNVSLHLDLETIRERIEAYGPAEAAKALGKMIVQRAAGPATIQQRAVLLRMLAARQGQLKEVEAAYEEIDSFGDF